MTAKQFFKSTAFKCIAVLLSIMLICGVLLTICNAFLAVSPEEELARTIAGFYGESVEFEEAEPDPDFSSSALYTINEVYDINGEHDGDYLLKVRGAGGYPRGNGFAVAWVIVRVDENNEARVTRVSLPSSDNESQSFLSYITDSVLESVIGQYDGENFGGYSPVLGTGATYTMTATTNCMNGALQYVRSVYCGELSPYARYEYNDYIDDSTTITVDGSDVTYNIVTVPSNHPAPFTFRIKVGADGTISEYTIVIDGSTSNNGTDFSDLMSDIVKDLKGQTQQTLEAMLDDGSLSTGATLSNTRCVQAALFATANYSLALSEYSEGGAE